MASILHDESYQEGKDAYSDDKLVSDNPYNTKEGNEPTIEGNPRSTRFAQWEAGFIDAAANDPLAPSDGEPDDGDDDEDDEE